MVHFLSVERGSRLSFALWWTRAATKGSVQVAGEQVAAVQVVGAVEHVLSIVGRLLAATGRK